MNIAFTLFDHPVIATVQGDAGGDKEIEFTVDIEVDQEHLSDPYSKAPDMFDIINDLANINDLDEEDVLQEAYRLSKKARVLFQLEES